MKKTIYIIFFLIIFSQKEGEGQVAKIFESTISDELIILIGPLNVDSYYPDQAFKYISKYKRMDLLINDLIEYLEIEISDLEKKKIKYPSKIKDKKRKIEDHVLDLELLENFIFLWEEHDLVTKNFFESFDINLSGDKCYSFVSNGDTIEIADVEIIPFESNDKLICSEFINGDYWTPVMRMVDENFNIFEEIKKTSKKSINLGDYEHVLLIEKSNIHDKIEGQRFHSEFKNRELVQIILDIDDFRVIKKIERMFPTFVYDKDKSEFYNEERFVLQKGFYQIILKKSGRQIIPESWFLTNCN